MNRIRQFEEERKVWESERCILEEKHKALSSEKKQVEGQLVQLQEELEQLRAAQGTSPAHAPQPGPAEPAEQVRSRHEMQLSLMAKIDELRNALQQEQQRSRGLEQRAAESEKTNRRLTLELERSGEGTPLGSPFGDLDCSVRSVRSFRGAARVSSDDDDDKDELTNTIRTLQSSRKEVLSLEDESLRLREELNIEKQKVIELKRAGYSRAAAWKEELQKITEELAAKQRLEEQVAQLRSEHARFRSEVGHLTEREASARREAARLLKEVQEARATKKEAQSGAAEEMQILSSVVGGQLMAVEQELTQQMKKSSQMFELFLRKAHEPLAKVRRSCRKLASSGASGDKFWMQAVPSLFEPNVHDLHGNLRKIVELLRFVAEVLEAHEQQREEQQQLLQEQQHQLLPLQQREPGLYDRLEEGRAMAQAWMKPFLT